MDRGESKVAARIKSLKLSEAEFTKQVIQLANRFGWRVAHFRPAMMRSGKWATAVQGDGKGFPDLFAVHAKLGRQFVAELKVGKNSVTPEQADWLEDCKKAGIAAFIWRPESWDEIIAVLRGDQGC